MTTEQQKRREQIRRDLHWAREQRELDRHNLEAVERRILDLERKLADLGAKL